MDDDMMKHLRFFKDDRERIKAMPQLPPEALLYIQHLEEVARRGARLRLTLAGTDEGAIRRANHQLGDELEFLDFLGEE